MSLTSSARRLAAMDREELRFRLRCEARKALQRARHAVIGAAMEASPAGVDSRWCDVSTV